MVSISEANEMAIEALNAVAVERGFMQEKAGWSMTCSKTALDVSYVLLTPQKGDEYELVSTEKIILLIAVRCQKIDDLLKELFPNSAEKNIPTCVTSNQLICKKILSRAKIDLTLNTPDMRLYFFEYFRLFLDNCEQAILNLTQPNNLLKAFKKQTTIYYIQNLFLSEIALDIHLGKLQDALDLCTMLSKGASESGLQSDLLSVERYIKNLIGTCSQGL